MFAIDFNQKISFLRPFSKPIEGKDEYDIMRQFERNRGHIIYSAIIRCLQQTTQVFPAERNATMHNRLTYLMKVQQGGRHITKEILNKSPINNRFIKQLDPESCSSGPGNHDRWPVKLLHLNQRESELNQL